MKKLFALLLALCLCACAFSALADSDLEYIQSKGTLVVGITDFAPMDYKDDNGQWIGVDADLATAFAESLGVTVEFVEINWDNKELELNSKTVDCIWNGMTLTDEVEASMSCTESYLDNAQVIVMTADTFAALPDEVDSEELATVMANYSFAVEAGSNGEAVATEYGLNATPVESQAAALLEVSSGTSDGAIIDYLMAKAMVGEGTSYASLTYGFELNAEQYGVGFRQESDLTALCNDFLSAKEADGSMMELLVKYGVVAAE